MVTKALNKTANQNNRKNGFKKKEDPTGLQTVELQRNGNQNGFTVLTTVGGRRQGRNNTLKRNIFKQASYQLRLQEKPLQTCTVSKLTCHACLPITDACIAFDDPLPCIFNLAYHVPK